MPRKVDKLSKVTSVHAGSQFHFATTLHKQTYFWGQTKMSGEATMYPKVVHDLSGWAVRALSCGPTATMLCAGESVVAWGPSPACGELCFGDAERRRGAVVRTAPKPKLVACMEGATTVDVRLGLQFSAMVVRRDAAGEAVLDKLADLDEVDAAPAQGTKRAPAPAAQPAQPAKSKARRRK